ncbi:uncharacterized protein LOC117174933 [Belonocnema kinseyi]|uniref:uncharacterized protein LOC117174933 n=1 Tax=Belonocnema kinseyi TaxID=2817044 RepID=UPI00143DFF90|nr:uncharacterized protein LOC117174933 [Belonocnema kinseyi]
MGISEISLWVLIRRYDLLETGCDIDELETSFRRFTLPSGSTLDELKSSIYSWIEIEEDTSRVFKIRRHDNNLIPLSSLLSGSSKDKPFIIDIVRVHQFCPVEKRTIPPGYIDALRSKLTNLETRVIEAENSLPQVASAHIQAVKEAASQLANCVGFLDRRVDELSPPQWKAQLNSAAS